MKKTALMLFILVSSMSYSQPHGNGGGNGSGKDKPCPPNNPHCGNKVPIKGIEWLILGGIVIGTLNLIKYTTYENVHRNHSQVKGESDIRIWFQLSRQTW